MHFTQQMYVAKIDGTIYREVDGRDFYMSTNGRFFPWEVIETALQKELLEPFDETKHDITNVPIFPTNNKFISLNNLWDQTLLGSLIHQKVTLYRTLISRPVIELSKQEVDIMYALSFDRDIQNVLQTNLTNKQKEN